MSLRSEVQGREKNWRLSFESGANSDLLDFHRFEVRSPETHVQAGDDVTQIGRLEPE